MKKAFVVAGLILIGLCFGFSGGYYLGYNQGVVDGFNYGADAGIRHAVEKIGPLLDSCEQEVRRLKEKNRI